MKWTYAAALLLLLPISAAANVPEGTARIATSVEDVKPAVEEEYFYSSSFSSDADGASESVLYFNDGFGRLTSFETETKDGVMTLTIRQNMNVLWKGSRSVKSHRFTVKKENVMGRIVFKITLGEHKFTGEFDSRDKWIMTEGDSAAPDEKIPLTAADKVKPADGDTVKPADTDKK